MKDVNVTEKMKELDNLLHLVKKGETLRIGDIERMKVFAREMKQIAIQSKEAWEKAEDIIKIAAQIKSKDPLVKLKKLLFDIPVTSAVYAKLQTIVDELEGKAFVKHAENVNIDTSKVIMEGPACLYDEVNIHGDKIVKGAFDKKPIKNLARHLNEQALNHKPEAIITIVMKDEKLDICTSTSEIISAETNTLFNTLNDSIDRICKKWSDS